MPGADRTLRTYRYERWRAVSAGILESAATTFLLLIAVRAYSAGPLSKALIASGGSAGLIIAPWVVTRVEALGWPVSSAAARLSVLGALGFLLAGLVPWLPVYVLGCAIALATSGATVPFLTQMYQENYPQHERGRRFARTIMVRIAAAAIFSDLAGRGLSGHIERYRVLLVVFVAASGFAAFCLARCPTQRLAASDGTHPFRALRFFREDRLFRQTIIAWMFLGSAMLMMSPMRVEYLANPKYGVTLNGQILTAGMVALLTSVIPNIARLILNPLWGHLFDRMNFFKLRIVLNLGFALGILSFFSGGSLAGLVAGAVFFGISNAGADVAWSLWVTKFAPPERVADYMSVHTFFTGVRGVFAPAVAFYAVSGIDPSVLGWVSVGLIAIGSAFLLPEIRFGKQARLAFSGVEKVSE